MHCYSRQRCAYSKFCVTAQGGWGGRACEGMGGTPHERATPTKKVKCTNQAFCVMRNFSNQDKLVQVLRDIDGKWLDGFLCGSTNLKMGPLVQHLRDKYHAKYPGEQCILPPYLKRHITRYANEYANEYTEDQIYTGPPPKINQNTDLVRFQNEVHSDFFMFWQDTVQKTWDHLLKQSSIAGKRRAKDAIVPQQQQIASHPLQSLELLNLYRGMSAEAQIEFQMMILPDQVKDQMLAQMIQP